MKKTALFMAAVLLALSLASCGNANNNNTEDSTADTTDAVTTEATTTEELTTEAPADDNTPEAGTFGAIIYDAFRSAYAANNTATAEELAGAIAQDGAIPFMAVAQLMEVGGYLPGFPEATITGNTEVAFFGPMISSIPFVGYVFTLEEGTDANTFVDSLKAGANMSWNVCTTADQMVIDVQGDKVLFVMCPLSTVME